MKTFHGIGLSDVVILILEHKIEPFHRFCWTEFPFLVL